MLGDDATHLKKLVLRRSPGYVSPDGGETTGDWLLECRRFPKVVLPKQFGGTPGRRTVDAADRGRLTSEVGSEASGSKASVKIGHATVTDLHPPSLKASPTEQTVVSDEVEKKKEVVTPSPEECNKLFQADPYIFHEECCLKASSDIHLRDHRCHLRQLLEKAQAKELISSVKSSDTKKPVEFEDDISELGKAHDQEDGEEKDDVLIEEITQQKEGWRHEYYVVLGFFLVFMAFFLIIVAVLVYKLKKNKTVTFAAPSTPGVAPAGLNLTQQRARGYSAIEDDQGDRAALTPATEQAQAFQYPS